MSTASDPDWIAHPPSEVASASRRNNLFFGTAMAERRESLTKVHDLEDALIRTPDARATRAQALAV
jgi:hypothetical protein